MAHEFQQGSAAWVAHRATKYNGSDAAAMLGLSAYKKRTDLLREMATGITPDVDSGTQARFNRGHDYEAMARPWAEELIGEDLYPATISADVDGLPLGASLDGLNMSDTITWEHKTLNQEIGDSLARQVIPAQYEPQMEQGLLISGASRCLFMASNGSRETMVWQWYESKPAVRAALIAGWKQFAEDVANWSAPPTEVMVTATVTEALPAVSVRMDGAIAVISNLDIFGEKLRAFIENIDKAPSTDQAFADAEAACKTLGTAEDALKQAEAAALAQTSSIDDMRRTVGHYADMARSTRLMLEKIVKARKEQIRVEIQQEAQQKFAEHVAAINKRLGKVSLPAITANFALVMKGKKTVSSVRSAVDDELARVKIEANALGEKIDANLRSLRELGGEFPHLFHDAQTICQKAHDDLVALVTLRVNEHKAAEQAKADRIAAEARQKLLDEQATAERKRIADEAAAVRVAQPTEPEALPDVIPSTAPDAAAWPEPVRAAAPELHAALTSPATVSSIGRVGPAAARPTDDAIVTLVSTTYQVSKRTAVEWLRTMNLQTMVAA